MRKLIALILICASSARAQVARVDSCYNLSHPVYGVTGVCIPSTSCRTNVVGPPQSCPSFPSGHVCCFDPERFPGREERGAWIATVYNIDWPSSPTASVATQQTQLYNLLHTLRSAGINSVYFQVRPAGDALYASSIEPWSRFITGAQGTPPNPAWDPLAYAIQVAHAINIEVHAWINPYRANMAANTIGLAPNHMAIQYPQFAYQFGTLLWMDPGAAVVQNRTYDVCMDLVRRYNLDGLHMDDYFYPYPVAGVEFPDQQTYNSYLAAGGTLGRDDWRRDNVNRLVQRLNVGLHQVKPWIKFSISPFGIYRPCHPQGMPCSISGLDQYTALFSDPKLWLQQGWVDILQPQLYWQIAPPAQSYPVLLDWWVAQNTRGRHVYAGNYLSRLLEGWNIQEIMNQIHISREMNHRNRGSWGNVQYSARMINENVQGSISTFRKEVYAYDALTPLFPWLANAAMKSTPNEVNVTVNGNNVCWQYGEDDGVHKIAVYKKSLVEWNVYEIHGAQTQCTNLEAGIYATTTVDRYGQESPKVYTVIESN